MGSTISLTISLAGRVGGAETPASLCSIPAKCMREIERIFAEGRLHALMDLAFGSGEGRARRSRITSKVQIVGSGRGREDMRVRVLKAFQGSGS
jgi:hypothetical protein